MMEYKGYLGSVEHDPEIDAFVGRIINAAAVITFYGTSVEQLHQEMKLSVDTYLEVCAEKGIKPEKPYKGEFLVRTSPDIHRAVAIAANSTGESVNAWVSRALKRAAEEQLAGLVSIG